MVLTTPTYSQATDKPRIVNIVNFIRLLEPRDAAITQEVLYETVVKQVELMKKHELPGSFLLQYDALMDSRYQSLLKSLPTGQFEIGGWWEIPQPLVEKAGLKWRGRFPWDWHADVGFSTGYTPRERELLIDVYMKDFKAIFGYYPRSVASWFIDEHSLRYFYEKYKIAASANCKDQYGTDGYTLWGGYWNQAYYPSKVNSFMPAQNAANQIPVPVFRLLGSDPVRQYDLGLGSQRQGVVSLEPVYPDAGGDSAWINWFFREFTEGASLAFAYTQTGQENSFTWPAMAKGLEIQFPLIAKLRKEGKVTVQTLAKSGEWFKSQFSVTPPTSVTINNDLGNSKVKTSWFNSRFYRSNLYWEENGTLRFRDIHLFDERLPSPYLTEKATSNECNFFTFPLVDGYRWSEKGRPMAGLWFTNVKGEKLRGETPSISDSIAGQLLVRWPLQDGGDMMIQFDEKNIHIWHEGKSNIDWNLQLTVSKIDAVPAMSISARQIESSLQGHAYRANVLQGKPGMAKGSTLFSIIPDKQRITLNLENNPGK